MAINTVKLNYTLIYTGTDTLLRFDMSESLSTTKKTYGEKFEYFDFTNAIDNSTHKLMVGSIDKSNNVTLKWNDDKKSIDVIIHQDADFNIDAKAYLDFSIIYNVISRNEEPNPIGGLTGSTGTYESFKVSFIVRSSNDDATQGKNYPSVEPYYVPKLFKEKTNVKTEDDPVELEVTIGSVDGSDLPATIADVVNIAKEEIQADKMANPSTPEDKEYSLTYDEESTELRLFKGIFRQSTVNLSSLKGTGGSGFEMPSDYNKEKNFGENVKAYLNGYVYGDWINSKLLDGPTAADEVSKTILSNAMAWSKIGVRVTGEGEYAEPSIMLTYTENENISPKPLLVFPVSLIANEVRKDLYTKQEVDALIENLRKELKPDS